jgi:argininosuccinate synthase
MKIRKWPPQKNPTIVHVDADVGDEAEDVVEAAMDLAKKHHAASDLLLQLVDQLVTMMISKTTIWIPMLN